MKRLVLFVAALLALVTLSACTATQRAASVGALAGATIGGVTTGTLGGAAVGGAIGAVSGAVVGELLGRWRDDPTQCVYVDRRGRRFVDDCPEG
ncbi:MAG: glycine zipper domain-containing protein [Devosia sp.]|nr:glycine zipper domain-containing protein [Devosia sp.]